MAHYRTMLKRAELSAADLWSEKDEKYREVVVQIVRITQGEVVGEKGRKKEMPFLHLRSAHTGKMIEKPFGANATNCETIAGIAGSPDMKRWLNFWITLYVTKTEMGKGMRDCIRIKPEAAEPPAEPKSAIATSSPTTTQSQATIGSGATVDPAGAVLEPPPEAGR